MKQMVEAWTWASAHTVTYLQVMFLIVALFVVWYLAFNKKPSAVRREVQMEPNAQKTRVRSIVGDAWLNVLYDRLYEGKIKLEDFDYWCKRLKYDLGLNVQWRIARPHAKAAAAAVGMLKRSIRERREKADKAKSLASLESKRELIPDPKPQKPNGKLNITVEQEK